MNSQIDGKVAAFVTVSTTPQLDVGICHNGTLHEASFGNDSKAEVDVFETGSIGKTFTATLLAILAENNVVNLGDDERLELGQERGYLIRMYEDILTSANGIAEDNDFLKEQLRSRNTISSFR